jgi:hypothetical protein
MDRGARGGKGWGSQGVHSLRGLVHTERGGSLDQEAPRSESNRPLLRGKQPHRPRCLWRVSGGSCA